MPPLDPSDSSSNIQQVCVQLLLPQICQLCSQSEVRIKQLSVAPEGPNEDLQKRPLKVSKLVIFFNWVSVFNIFI